MDVYKIPIGLSLGVIAVLISGAVAASLLYPVPATSRISISTSGETPPLT